MSKRVVLPLVPRNGESELIERDLSGVEGRGAYRPAAEDFRGRRHSSTCPCVLHSSSEPAELERGGLFDAAAAPRVAQCGAVRCKLRVLLALEEEEGAHTFIPPKTLPTGTVNDEKHLP